MQEKAWSTGGLKKLINKIINKNVYGQYKTSNRIEITNDVEYYAISFDGTNDDILTNEFFVVNNTKQFVLHCYYDINTGSYKHSTVDYSNFNSFKILDTIHKLDEAASIYGYEINANGSYNSISIYKTALSYDVGDDIEVIYKNDKYGYYAVL